MEEKTDKADLKTYHPSQNLEQLSVRECLSLFDEDEEILEAVGQEPNRDAKRRLKDDNKS